MVKKSGSIPEFIYTTHAYLLKILMTHNNNPISLLYLLIDCISGGSAPRALSLKEEYTLRFLKFLIIGLNNYFVNCFLSLTTSELMPLVSSRPLIENVLNH